MNHEILEIRPPEGAPRRRRRELERMVPLGVSWSDLALNIGAGNNGPARSPWWWYRMQRKALLLDLGILTVFRDGKKLYQKGRLLRRFRVLQSALECISDTFIEPAQDLPPPPSKYEPGYIEPHEPWQVVFREWDGYIPRLGPALRHLWRSFCVDTPRQQALWDELAQSSLRVPRRWRRLRCRLLHVDVNDARVYRDGTGRAYIEEDGRLRRDRLLGLALRAWTPRHWYTVHATPSRERRKHWRPKGNTGEQP